MHISFLFWFFTHPCMHAFNAITNVFVRVHLYASRAYRRLRNYLGRRYLIMVRTTCRLSGSCGLTARSRCECVRAWCVRACVCVCICESARESVWVHIHESIEECIFTSTSISVDRYMIYTYESIWINESLSPMKTQVLCSVVFCIGPGFRCLHISLYMRAHKRCGCAPI